jgi:predicted transposase/invertase (TIGR01784 family)
VVRDKKLIFGKCETLDNYSIFMGKIREYRKKKKSLEKAVKNAIEYCIEKNILKEFLEAHSSEVLNMLLTEWNQDEAIEVAREEGIEIGLEQGHEEGLEEGKLIIAKNLLAKGSTIEFVHDITGLSMEKIKEINL